MNLSKYTEKLPKISLNPSFKKKLPTIGFILIIPLGILIGYFSSHIKGFFAGGFQGVMTPINKTLYVAKVDGVGIPKSEWEKTLKSSYGSTAAKELINIYMIRNELTKAGIKVTDEEVNAEIAAKEKQLGGQSLEEVLAQQGRTMEDLRKTFYLWVGMKKLLQDKITVTDQDVADYIKQVGSSLTGTEDEKKAQAKKDLTDQKIDEEISNWMTELQSKVKVENYLETK